MNVSHNNPQAWLDRLYETAIAYQKGHSVQRDRSRTLGFGRGNHLLRTFDEHAWYLSFAAPDTLPPPTPVLHTYFTHDVALWTFTDIFPWSGYALLVVEGTPRLCVESIDLSKKPDYQPKEYQAEIQKLIDTHGEYSYSILDTFPQPHFRAHPHMAALTMGTGEIKPLTEFLRIPQQFITGDNPRRGLRNVHVLEQHFFPTTNGSEVEVVLGTTTSFDNTVLQHIWATLNGKLIMFSGMVPAHNKPEHHNF